MKDFQKFITSIPKVSVDICFKAGYDAEVNGANTTNCHFSLFSAPQFTAAWENGKKQAVKDKQSAQQSVEPTEEDSAKNLIV